MYNKQSGKMNLQRALAAALFLLAGCGGGQGEEPSGPETPNNKPASATITAPSSAQVPTLQEIAIQYRLQDADGITKADLSGTFPDKNNNYEITKTFPQNTTSWDTTINRTLIAPGTATYDAILTSKTPTNTETTSTEKTTQITQKQTNDTQFPFSIQNTRAQQPTTYQLKATDTDTITTATIKEVHPQTNDTTTTTITDINNTEFNKEIQKTFTKQGTYSITLTITDKYNNKQTTTKTAEVLAEITQRTITLNTERQQANTQIAFDFQEQTQNNTTNNQGTTTFTFNAPKDSTIQYTITADALGLQQTSKQETSKQDTTTTITIPATPITIPTTIPGQHPRTTDTLNIRELITANDTEGQVPLTTTLQYTGNNLKITKIATNTYTFTTTNNDPANTLEEILITAQAPYNQKTQTTTKQIFKRRDIQYLQTSFQTTEQDSLTINDLRTIIESEATITTANITTTQQGLTIRQENEWGWVLKPQQATTYTFSINAENTDGKQESQQATLTVKPLPRANITAINTVTNQPIQSYLLLTDENNTVLDSVVSNNGQFSVPIPPQTTGLAVAEQINGQVKSFEHYIHINPEQEITKTLAVEDFRNYDINKNYIEDMSLFDMKRLKKLLFFIHGQAPVKNLNGDSQGNFPKILHRAVESTNGIGYDSLIIADTADVVATGEIGIMGPGVPELIKNEYLTKIAPLMEEFATPVEFKERISYLVSNESNRNKALMIPRLLDGEFGLVAVFARLPYINEHSLTQILQDGERNLLSEITKKRTTLQELTAAMIYFSQLPSDFINPENPQEGGDKGIPLRYLLEPHESIIHNSTTRLDLSKFDRKAGWMIYEPHHTPGEKIEHLLKVPAQIQQEYDAQ